jgi:mannose-6-phosphate isomerase-like protein (cupin superfamily)
MENITMKIYRSDKFKADAPWGSVQIANMDGITTRLHWTNKPYKWHINDGEEVFAVMHGEVDMHFKEKGEIKVVRLNAGDIFYASIGTEHVAHPIDEARVLVIEKEDSI